jgi:recombination associated protein RdgC
VFKNFRFYRIHNDWPRDEQTLNEALSTAAFKPCPAYSEKSIGFEPPIAILEDLLCRRLSGVDLIQLRYQTRLLPTAVIKEALGERVVEFERRTTRAPSRAEKREFKEEIYSELLPRALLKSDRIRAFYIKAEKVLAVATPSEKVAEELLDKLRDALGSLQATPLEYQKSAQTLMKQVMANTLGGLKIILMTPSDAPPTRSFRRPTMRS